MFLPHIAICIPPMWPHWVSVVPLHQTLYEKWTCSCRELLIATGQASRLRQTDAGGSRLVTAAVSPAQMSSGRPTVRHTHMFTICTFPANRCCSTAPITMKTLNPCNEQSISCCQYKGCIIWVDEISVETGSKWAWCMSTSVRGCRQY